MLQLIFLIPIVYLVVRRYDFFGTIMCLIVTAIWELIQYCWEMNEVSYKLLVFRYISIIAFGCFIAIGKIKLNKITLFSMFFVGFIWQVLQGDACI